MSRQADICRAVAEALRETFNGLPGVTVTLEDKCNPALEIENALGQWGVLVVVSASGHRRKPGTGASTAGDLAIDLTVIENPKHNRKSGVPGPTITSVAEQAKDALHWRLVDGRRLVYVEMQRADAADDDYRMAVSFVAYLASDPALAVTWTAGGRTIYGDVTDKKIRRGGETLFEPTHEGNAKWVGVLDPHWRAELVCTVEGDIDESDLPAEGERFSYGGRSYVCDSAELECSGETLYGPTVRLGGRTIISENQ